MTFPRPFDAEKNSAQTTKTIRKTALFPELFFYLEFRMTISVFHHTITDMNSVKFFFVFFILTASALFAGTAIRTPQTSGEPHINGPSVIGVTPGNSFLYKIPVSGDNPIQITVTNLPAGVTLRNGSVLEGRIGQPGDYRIKVTASGATASVSRILTTHSDN